MFDLQNRQFSDAHQRDCMRVIARLLEADSQSRRSLATHLDLTSTTTSRIISDLLVHGLVREEASDAQGRGRPATSVRLNGARLGFTVVNIVSQRLNAYLLDFHGQVLKRQSVDLDPQTDNAGMAQSMRDLLNALLAACPPAMIHVGTSITVAGIVDIKEKIWLITSRWPNVRSFDVGAALSDVTPHVLLFRQLDVELNVRFQKDCQQVENAALLHWGWGVGLSYRTKDRSGLYQQRPFGEIGHWRFDSLQPRKCGCGNSGCLETAVALSPLLPALELEELLDLRDEGEIGAILARQEIAGHPQMQFAVKLVARALGNMCRILFPQRVYVTGPFIANAAVFDLLAATFRAEGLVGPLQLPEFIAADPYVEAAVEGARQPLLDVAVDRLLVELCAQGANP